MQFWLQKCYYTIKTGIISKKYFFGIFPIETNNIDAIQVQERISAKKSQKCKYLHLYIFGIFLSIWNLDVLVHLLNRI